MKLAAVVLAVTLGAAGCSRKAALGGSAMVVGGLAVAGGIRLAAEGEPEVHTPLGFAGAMVFLFGLAAVIDSLDDERPAPATTP
jgi:hypothetical protein